MKIEIWSDFACPFCYIGKRKLEKAIENFAHKDKIEVIYRSYELNPNAQEEANNKGYEAFSETKGVSLDEAKQMFDQLEKTAKAYGLDYKMSEILMVSTRKAHRLAKWANTFNKEHEFTELVFDAYFTKGENIAKDEVLLGFVEKIDLNKEEAKKVIKENQFNDVVTNQINEGVSLGLRGVPFFVFNRKFAVAGAQPDEHFVEALNKAYEERPLNHVGSHAGCGCGDDGCDIK